MLISIGTIGFIIAIGYLLYWLISMYYKNRIKKDDNKKDNDDPSLKVIDKRNDDHK